MKKTFQLTHPKIKPARRVDAIKSEIKKYIKRERNKTLPEGVDYWDFDCKFGLTEPTADVVHLTAINKSIDEAVAAGADSFYVEVIVKMANRQFTAPDEDLSESLDEDED
ncbi:DUF6172 family protein [Thalassotalea castellviae]|uniref:DUF6172 family protein n=1 Tax=Thalassotalea castellviae TaxID=3075612 RepID=A0ABU3A3Z6_9GAMM|nr:DUF6172 family protein [Thalassotalea sp. W431]MDT0604901.1 DUF6172 family protein [Thalassotalea sp. W431]